MVTLAPAFVSIILYSLMSLFSPILYRILLISINLLLKKKKRERERGEGERITESNGEIEKEIERGKAREGKSR